MKVFEINFNPKNGRERIFDSFVYDPETPQEKELGSLCMGGELNQVLPQNSRFLDSLSDVIKNGFYEKSDLQEALREANNFLDKEAKSGNVSWLGNLDFALLNIKDSILNFTKVGDIKILLLREGEVLDISQNLELQDQEPYPLKVFSNIASGKLSGQDKILIVTSDIFSVISENEAFFSELGYISEDKDLKTIFRENKEAFSEVSGICLLVTQNAANSKAIFPEIKLMPKKIPNKIILILILILILASAYFIFKFKVKREIQPPPAQVKLEEVRYKIMMAENFIIMKNDEKARALFREALDMLSLLQESYMASETKKETASLRESIEEYLNKNNPASQ